MTQHFRDEYLCHFEPPPRSVVILLAKPARRYEVASLLKLERQGGEYRTTSGRRVVMQFEFEAIQGLDRREWLVAVYGPQQWLSDAKSMGYDTLPLSEI